ncbi:MAG: hypothetical protein JXB88_05090 [Spirochaetales bacterium]|nr:hypothetical protein [Spirochaetales bacterium]
MKVMISICGEDEQIPFLPEIKKLNAEVELGSYGLVGVQSKQAWIHRISVHRTVRSSFSGQIVLHGPFVGIEYAHFDHLIRRAVEKRIDMIFDAAVHLNAFRVVLHSGFTAEVDMFARQDI